MTSCQQNEMSGEYINTSNNGLYKSIDFKGKTTVVVKIGLFDKVQPEIASSYVVDGNLVRIHSENGDLLFKVIDKNNLVGEGFAEGKYTKK